MRDNLLKQKLNAGQTVFGCFLRFADAEVAEFLSLQGFDFLVLDAEHGVMEPRDCQHMARAADLHDVTPLVRVPTNNPTHLLRYLDTGAHGAHVPMVNSAEQAEAAVQAIKYQPRGRRGLAGARAADYGQRLPLDEYTRFANEQTLVTVQIETIAAVEALPEIVKVDGVDVIFVGPTDLSNSLGVTGQSQHPKMKQTLDRIVELVVESDKTLAIMVPGAEAARTWVQRGARYITVTCEAMLAAACRPYLASVRDRASV